MENQGFRYLPPRKATHYERVFDAIQKRREWKNQLLDAAAAHPDVGRITGADLDAMTKQYANGGGKITLVPARGRARGW